LFHPQNQNAGAVPDSLGLLAVTIAAGLKTTLLYTTIVLLIMPTLNLLPAQSAAFTTVFSVNQLVTALIGGALAVLSYGSAETGPRLSKRSSPMKPLSEYAKNASMKSLNSIAHENATDDDFERLPNGIRLCAARSPRNHLQALDIPVAEIYGIVTFYSMFSLKPKGKLRHRHLPRNRLLRPKRPTNRQPARRDSRHQAGSNYQRRVIHD
jgi:hypothetical protein